MTEIPPHESSDVSVGACSCMCMCMCIALEARRIEADLNSSSNSTACACAPADGTCAALPPQELDPWVFQPSSSRRGFGFSRQYLLQARTRQGSARHVASGADGAILRARTSHSQRRCYTVLRVGSSRLPAVRVLCREAVNGVKAALQQLLPDGRRVDCPQ